MMEQQQELVVRLVDGVEIAVPNILNTLSTYVLCEQLDWFEAELPFLRRLLQPGDFVLDVGASYGTYALSLANKVGPFGQVFAFEPNPNVMSFLRKSVQYNRFSNVHLDCRGLAGETTKMYLTRHLHSECQGLTTSADGAAVTVETTTLDQLVNEHQWNSVDFIKIDVEGFERPVLEGATEFFRRYSPLVLYEVQPADKATDCDLLKMFESCGLQSYGLIPGLDLLVPIDPDVPIAPYTINAFACDNKRANLLRPTNRLLLPNDCEISNIVRVCDLIRSQLRNDMLHLCETLPFSRGREQNWRLHNDRTENCAFAAIQFYCESRDVSRSSLERWVSLKEAERLMTNIVKHLPTPQMLSTLVRILLDLGNRSKAVDLLNQAWNAMTDSSDEAFNGPFLPCQSRYDRLIPNGDWEDWLRASLIEAVELWGKFSSYYDPENASKRLEYLRFIGYLSPDCKRRLDLLNLFKPSNSATSRLPEP